MAAQLRAYDGAEDRVAGRDLVVLQPERAALLVRAAFFGAADDQVAALELDAATDELPVRAILDHEAKFAREKTRSPKYPNQR